MDINGIAHVILTAGDFEKSTNFYRAFLPFLGMTLVVDTEFMLYGVGARTAIGVRPPSEAHKGEKFVQERTGLHHLCYRARDRASIDEAHKWLKDHGVTIVHAPEDGPWAPGYYSILFEDPDGVRLEINHVPGKGLFETGGKMETY